MDLEQTLEKVVELAREELHIVRKRAEEKTRPVTTDTTTTRPRTPLIASTTTHTNSTASTTPNTPTAGGDTAPPMNLSTPARRARPEPQPVFDRRRFGSRIHRCHAHR